MYEMFSCCIILYFRVQLLDIVAAAQTVPAHKAAMSVLKFNGPIELPERYLLSLSLATHPPETIIQSKVSLFLPPYGGRLVFLIFLFLNTVLSFCTIPISMGESA